MLDVQKRAEMTFEILFIVMTFATVAYVTYFFWQFVRDEFRVQMGAVHQVLAHILARLPEPEKTEETAVETPANQTVASS